MYTPFDIVPTEGAILQFTPVLLVFAMVAAKVADCPPCSEAEVGDTEMVTAGAGGTSEMVALALFVLSATLVAFTVTVCADAMVAGAV